MIDLQSVRDKISKQPAILLYFKNDNCAPCHVLRPKVKELIEQYFPKIELIIIDSMEQPEYSGAFQVYANPTILLFFDGKESLRKSKYVSIAELKSEISRPYQLIFS